MRFRFLSYLRCRRAEDRKATGALLSRAIATHNLRNDDSDPEDYFMTRYCQIFGHNRKQLDPTRLDLLLQFQHDFSSSPYILNKFVSICAKSAFFTLGSQLHTAVIKLGFLSNIYICTALIDLYGKYGLILDAQKLFDAMIYRNVVVWNSLMCGYLQVKCPDISINLFVEMMHVGIAPMPVSISAVLLACSQMQAGELGIQVHGLSLKMVSSYNVVIGTNLIDMYSKCWNLEDSRRIFYHMVDRNVITWTSMVSGCVQNHQSYEAMVLVREMLRFGVNPSNVTYNSLLSSFSKPDHLHNCKQIHCRIIKEGLEANAYLVITLITVYSDCGSSLQDFWKVCSGVSEWDQISWNAVIAGISKLGDESEALIRFSLMRQASVSMDKFTFSSILRAAGIITALNEGKQIHALIFKSGQPSNLNVQNGLVSMYSRCGSIHDLKKVFLSMAGHDVVSWNSLLTGYAHHGYGKEVVLLFEKMRRTEIKPNNTTFLAVLTACSHVGMLDKGLEYFQLMIHDPALEPPKMEHYATIVDLLGRFGYLNEAESFIKHMPKEAGPSAYKTLLGACQIHGNKEIALRSANKLLKLRPNDPATYILLSNVMDKYGCWADAAGVRRLMRDKGLSKNPGRSWI